MKKMKTSIDMDFAKEGDGFAFGRKNYILILIGVAIVITGFMLMTGGGSKDPNVFIREEIFSTRRITVAPITVLAGYIFIIYAIMKKA